MSKAQGGLREVIDHWKDDRKGGDRKKEKVAVDPEPNKRDQDGHEDEDIPGENKCHEKGVRVEKMSLGRFGAEPCGDNSPAEES